MNGGFCLNEWLIREGYLSLAEHPTEVTRFEEAQVDWPRTAAWGDGGYYGRLFINVRGREPQGLVEPADYERVRNELRTKLEGLTDDRGMSLNVKVFKPQETYQTCRNIPPDLIIYFGDLSWRSVGSVGHRTLHVFENDTGPDDANHSQYGIFIMWDPRSKRGRYLEDAHILDCAPTILDTLGVPIPSDMRGKILV
jgi:predicted AlkP superfamily phosphohydrolase/phosphomutase